MTAITGNAGRQKETLSAHPKDNWRPSPIKLLGPREWRPVCFGQGWFSRHLYKQAPVRTQLVRSHTADSNSPLASHTGICLHGLQVPTSVTTSGPGCMKFLDWALRGRLWGLLAAVPLRGLQQNLASNRHENQLGVQKHRVWVLSS